jgi:hypothetical protein
LIAKNNFCFTALSQLSRDSTPDAADRPQPQASLVLVVVHTFNDDKPNDATIRCADHARNARIPQLIVEQSARADDPSWKEARSPVC